jgi:hypothetical protein
MPLDDYNHPVQRSVWENKNGSRVTTVTGLLNPGKYEVDKTEKKNGKIVLEYTPVDAE